MSKSKEIKRFRLLRGQHVQAVTHWRVPPEGVSQQEFDDLVKRGEHPVTETTYSAPLVAQNGVVVREGSIVRDGKLIFQGPSIVIETTDDLEARNGKGQAEPKFQRVFDEQVREERAAVAAAAPIPDNLDQRTEAELRKFCDDAEIDHGGLKSKGQLVRALREQMQTVGG